jgi:tetratricopeptide (TPR) repeat protein
MRLFTFSAALACCLFFGGPMQVLAEEPDDWTKCKANDNYSVRIAVCTRVINAGKLRKPDLVFAYRIRGFLYIQTKDFDRAIADFSDALKLDPNDADALVGRSTASRGKGDEGRAAADYAKAVKLNPALVDAVTCVDESGDVAIVACSRAIASEKMQGERLANLYQSRGIEYSNKNQRDRARADFDPQAISINPNSFGTYNARGDDYRILKDYDHAIADLNRAIELNPAYAQGFKTRADTYRDKGDYDRAIADYSEAIRLAPNFAAAYYNRGTLYERKKDYARAIDDFSNAIRINPTNASYFNLRCWDGALLGRDYERALADCNESLRLRPNDGNVLNSRGLVQLKSGAFDKAIADYGASIALNPKDADSLYGRGIAKIKSGDSKGGDADIAAAEAIKSDIAQVFIGYGVK